mmetsp:Transcript_33975/g.71459  ORF Transcript_33975/g.71459 Transcript_33975/m.71459 type:complete len:391 (-) Transcript_33975:502-1674(-)
MALSSSALTCKFIPPSLQSWTYAVTVHVTCCIAGAVPLGIILFFVQRSTAISPRLRRVVCVIVGTSAVLIVPAAQSYIENGAPNENIRWTGPFLASTFGFSTFFKAINAGFDQFPEGADANLSTWLMWFVNLPEPEFTKGKICRANKAFVLVRLKFFVCKILSLFVLLTLLQIIHQPAAESNNHKLQIPEWLQSIHIDGFLHLWLLYLFVSCCLDFSSLSNIATTGGMRTEPAFENPLLQSRCFAEAWGARWNLPVQLLLKRTIYVPARKNGLGRSLSAILTFFASGLLHEYNFSIHNRQAYEPVKATVFFVLMGLLMMGEKWAWENLVPLRVRQIAAGYIPSVVIATALTFSVSGIFNRFFIKSWLESGFLDAAREMLPHLSCTHVTID